MKTIDALKEEIRNLIPSKNGEYKLNANTEVTISVYNYFNKSNHPEKFMITKVERVNGYYLASDGFNEFSVNELLEDDANKILSSL